MRVDVELESCPFCGSEAELVHTRSNALFPSWWKVQCTECWCKTEPEFGSSGAKRKVVKVWNKRAKVE